VVVGFSYFVGIFQFAVPGGWIISGQHDYGPPEQWTFN
jgi:hypothetical protein